MQNSFVLQSLNLTDMKYAKMGSDHLAFEGDLLCRAQPPLLPPAFILHLLSLL